MKKILVIVLLMISTLSFAQERWQNYTRIGMTAGSVALNAVGDGLKDDGHKVWGHSANAASIALLLLNPIITDIQKEDLLPYISQYVLIRFAVFDYTYNATRRLPFGYTGTTSHYDKFMQKVPDGFELWSKSLVFTVGIKINLNM
jgi:hypothetical protein